MNERTRDVVETTSYLLSGNRRSRAGRMAGAVLGKAIEQEGGKVTGRLVVAILVVLAVVGVAFVAYRLLMLDLIMGVLENQG
ncbi:hypothetical protein OWR29_47795 [Actinoplanes sp. Pm04-4]|uniref:Uncharacterized protein n=1 Tax=Paractinoplanes pyxinae TaxID=2997416 RepID=A0ABT4BIU2_9ACTN|nr:hypothetical protein [Actinoplanes pyxinae]MCY1145750.1 hypothetical protein [Actinoplanes pyxinae]